MWIGKPTGGPVRKAFGWTGLRTLKVKRFGRRQDVPERVRCKDSASEHLAPSFIFVWRRRRARGANRRPDALPPDTRQTDLAEFPAAPSVPQRRRKAGPGASLGTAPGPRSSRTSGMLFRVYALVRYPNKRDRTGCQQQLVGNSLKSPKSCGCSAVIANPPITRRCPTRPRRG